MEREEEASHTRRNCRYQEPFSPAIETVAGEHAKQHNQASKNSDKADDNVNDCVDLQYHGPPITSTFARTVTSRFVAIARLALGRCPDTGVACWSESSGLGDRGIPRRAGR